MVEIIKYPTVLRLIKKFGDTLPSSMYRIIL